MSKSKYLFLIISLFFPCMGLYAQEFMTQEQEIEIKISGNYYWAEGSDFDVVSAKKYALDELSNYVVTELLTAAVARDELIANIKMNARFSLLPREGKSWVLAWVHKDSVLCSPSDSRGEVNGAMEEESEEKSDKVNPEVEHIPDPIDPIYELPEDLLSCKTFTDFKRKIILNGYIYGNLNTSKGFENPEDCFIAVFDRDGSICGILTPGTTSRRDLITGDVIEMEDADDFNDYIEQYVLWYFKAI